MQSNHKPPNKHFVVHKSYSQFAGPLRRAISYFVSYLVLGLISKKDYRETRTRGAAAAKGPLLGAWLCQSPPGPLPAYASPIEPVVSLLYIACHGVQTPTDHPGAVGPQEAPTAAQGRTSRVHRPQGGGGRTSGEDSPRAGRRATWWPPSAQPRAARSPSAISPRGRSTTASSGRLGPVPHLAVEITQIRR